MKILSEVSDQLLLKRNRLSAFSVRSAFNFHELRSQDPTSEPLSLVNNHLQVPQEISGKVNLEWVIFENKFIRRLRRELHLDPVGAKNLSFVYYIYGRGSILFIKFIDMVQQD